MKNSSLPLWITLSLTVVFLINIGKLMGIDPIKSSVYGGIAFLLVTIIPIQFRTLVRYRRDFGIVSGVLVSIHSALAFVDYFDWSLWGFLTKNGLAGLIAQVIFTILLVTSDFKIQRMLGQKWRVIHAFVWFSLPIALMHAIVAARIYTGDTPVFAVIMLGGLVAFGVIKVFFPRTNKPEALRDVALVFAGSLVSAGLYFLW